jgi:hypothetical protein
MLYVNNADTCSAKKDTSKKTSQFDKASRMSPGCSLAENISQCICWIVTRMKTISMRLLNMVDGEQIPSCMTKTLPQVEIIIDGREIFNYDEL